MHAQPRKKLPLPLALWLLASPAAVLAQTPAPVPATAPAPAAEPAPAEQAKPAVPARPATPATTATPATAPPAASGQRVEITGGRQSDTEQRRQATASKIVIGREDIDKFGDATLGEVLRRLPGVTTPGAPGRGGPPRLRGLGNGFTQILIDGQRVPPGFSLESLTPEQVERIEILRAPTAETGARAIAGTINIITREGFRRRLNDLRLGLGYENGQLSPGLNWTHNDSAGDLTYNLSGSAFRGARKNSSRSITTVQSLDAAGNPGAITEDRTLQSDSLDKRFGTNITARLQWRLNESGDSLALMPSVFHTESHGDSTFSLDKRQTSPSTPAYDIGNSVSDGRFTVGRLGLMWRQRVGPVRVEANGSAGISRGQNDSLRNEFLRGAAEPQTVTEDHSSSRERSANLTLKNTLLVGGDATKPSSEQTLVWGVEAESVERTETRTTLQGGRNILAGFNDDQQASSLRLAAYGQDEWTINPNWSAYAGLRWEGITTKGSAATPGDGRPTNRSSVWTPLAHAVWKPDPKSRDQVRFSLTRSYRSPPVSTLIARPSINRDYAVNTANTFTSPDSAGNPNLKPELATGIDVAFERYLESGGLLSANLFRRNISNLIRGVTSATPEVVSWSPGAPRYVRRQQNIGDAVTQGVELEAKFRLDQLVTGAPGVEMRSNLSFFDSKVKTVPGPDNRLDQQAKATANFGADYRIRGTPFTLGGNVNWVPGYTTRLEQGQTVTVDTKRVWDAYALWTFNPSVALRLLGSNLDPRAYDTVNVTDVVTVQPRLVNERTTVRSGGASYINWQLRLELKL